jgi:hypothetical protein
VVDIEALAQAVERGGEVAPALFASLSDDDVCCFGLGSFFYLAHQLLCCCVYRKQSLNKV